MTYPPGSPGYPSAQQPTTQFAAPTQQFGKPDTSPPAHAAEGQNKLPLYLTAAVAALGLAVYVSSYGPLFEASADFFTPTLLDLGVVASLLAGLIAGAALVPKQKAAPALMAVLSVLGFLLALAIVLTAPSGVSVEWGLYLIIAFSVVQAIIAVAVLLFDAGVIAPPAPKPRYEQQQYGQYGGPGPYYGQPHQPGPPPQQQHQQPPQHQQRPGYPSQYGGGYQGGPPSGGYSGGQHSGPPTPPTGFPTYGQPPSSGGSGSRESSGKTSNASSSSNAPTTQVPVQPSSSTQSGPPPS
ncbi:MAG TPA: DUF5336 domain-containing protein [Mycobacterium sp.]|nr:DUF5336 domain-containing protein [Mycobacterium sp.]